MEKITEVLNKHFSLPAGATEAELPAQIQSEFDNLNRLFSELERPEYREYIRFAIAWQDVEREMTALRVKVKERLAEKPVNLIDEFLKKLLKKN